MKKMWSIVRIFQFVFMDIPVSSNMSLISRLDVTFCLVQCFSGKRLLLHPIWFNLSSWPHKLVFHYCFLTFLIAPLFCVILFVSVLVVSPTYTLPHSHSHSYICTFQHPYSQLMCCRKYAQYRPIPITELKAEMKLYSIKTYVHACTVNPEILGACKNILGYLQISEN